MKQFKVYIKIQSNSYELDSNGLIIPNGIIWDEMVVEGTSKEEVEKELEEQFKNNKLKSCRITNIEEIN